MWVGVPPPEDTVAVPLLPPLHVTLVLVALAVSIAGSLTVYVLDMVQLLASVTNTVYVPSVKLLAVAPLPPLGDQL